MSGDFSLRRKMKKMQSLYWLGRKDGHVVNAGKYENEKYQQ